MDLVVGASESTVKSLLGKLGGLLAQEYTLIRGVGGDLQYISDELRTMQSFLRDLGEAKHDHRTKDWMKQIRDMTYDVEDCVDDSGNRIHNPRWLRSDITCYFLVNSVYELVTWWPRRDIASKISDLKARAQQISERRQRYGVDNPKSEQKQNGAAETGAGSGTSSSRITGFDAAENQERSLKLIATKDPVGVDEHMNKLEEWMKETANKNRVLAIVGFGGVGKTIIATDLYRKFGAQYDSRAMVTVSQGSDLVAILTNIMKQVMPQSDDQKQPGSSPEKKSLAVAVRGMLSQFKCRCCSVCGTTDNPSDEPHSEGQMQQDNTDKPQSNEQEQSDDSDDEEAEKKSLAAEFRNKLGQVRRRRLAKRSTSDEARDNAKLDKLKKDLKSFLTENSCLLLIDDVWSTSMWDQIRRSLPLSVNKDSRIIVTTRFQAVARTCTGDDTKSIQNVKALDATKSEELFKQAISESKGNKDDEVPEEVWKMCGGLPLAIVTMAGHVACSPRKSPEEWRKLCSTLLPDSTKDRGKDVTKEEVGRNGIPSKTKTEGQFGLMPPGQLPAQATILAPGWNAACPDKLRQGRKQTGPESMEVREKNITQEEAVRNGIPSKTKTPESTEDRGKDLTQEEAGRIISHCYNDMPAEIKTCSLYLSIFPKGSRISRKRLTRRWIAEGFVSEKQGMSVEDVAETYFTHLIKRKIIRPVDHSTNGRVKNCVVHDMILEHIVATASDENFITVVGGHWLMQPPSTKVRRLSLQGGDSKCAKDTEKMNLSHLRSLTMFGSLDQLRAHSFKLRIVQVLDLEGCKDFRQHHTDQICKMLFLKYLSLRGTDIKKVPKAIRNLEKLETLDIRDTNVVKLPKSVCNLGQLVNILGGSKKTRKALRLPEDLVSKRKMAALRVLSGIEIVGESADLHHLTDLRKLAIYRLGIKKGSKAFEDLHSSIEYLGGFSLHTLVIFDESSRCLRSLDALASPPKFFIALQLCGKMVKLPRWITELEVLSKLTLSMTLLKEENLKELSKLKALFSLTFTSSATKQDQKTVTIIEENRPGPKGLIIIPADGFEKLKLLRFSAPYLPLLSFSQNAMSGVERLELRFSMLEGLLGTENLQSLSEVHVSLQMKKEVEHKEETGNVIDVGHIKKRIEDDIPSVKTSSVTKPKIIFNQ